VNNSIRLWTCSRVEYLLASHLKVRIGGDLLSALNRYYHITIGRVLVVHQKVNRVRITLPVWH